MENLIPVLVIGGIVGFLLWKNKDKILSAVGKGKTPEAVENVFDPVPEPVTPVPVSSTPVYNGEGEPPNQAAWEAWLATLPPSTRAFYPKVWKPTPVDNPDFGPFPEVDNTGRKFGGNGSEKVTLSTRFKSIPINHPTGFRGKLMVTVVEDAGSVSGTNARYVMEIAGDNVKPNHYEWGFKGGTMRMNIEGDKHEIRIKADKPATCSVQYKWSVA